MILFEGGHQLGDAADVSDLDDGAANHHGPAQTGRGHHGGEDHQGHHHLQKFQTHNGRVCLSKGCGNGHHPRRLELKIENRLLK